MELGLLVLAAYFGGRIARKLRIGEVIGQILGGILVGPHFLLLVSRWLSSHPSISGLTVMGPITSFFETRFNDYALIMEGAHFFVFLFLGIVAFSLGEELHWNRLKQVGIKATIICVTQAMLTWAVISLGFHYLFGSPWVVAMLIGSIGIATAPALTFILMSRFQIEGPLKNILANIVVLDDVIEVIVFSIMLSVTVGMKTGEHISAVHIFADVSLEMGLALIFGIILFAILRFAIRSYGDEHEPGETESSLLSTVLSDHPTPSVEILLIIIGTIAIVISVAMHFDLPFLIVAVFAGILVANFHTNALFDSLKLKDVMPVFNLLFFGIIGASVQIETFSLDTLFLVIGYFLLRTTAKLAGNWLGCKITGQDPKITASLPKLMLPQAGMAAVETILVSRVLGGADGEMVFNTIVPALVIFELVGAFLSERTLIRWKEWTAGEAEAVRSSKNIGEEGAAATPPLELDRLMPIPMQRITADETHGKTSVIDKLIETLYNDRYIEDATYTRNAIIEREQLGSTVLIDGVAMPHCRSESIDEAIAVGCILDNPVIWQIKPEKKVELVFMIISPKQKPDEHIKALQTIGYELNRGRFSKLLSSKI